MYKEYIEDVKSNKIITNEYIKLAVERFEKLFEREDLYFDEKKVNEVIDFIGHIEHYSGKTAHKKFILEKWQSFFIAQIFGFYYKKNNNRLINSAFLFMSRKNGKSAFVAAISLYMLLVDNEQAPEIYFAANSREQAKILFDMTSIFAEKLDPKQKILNIKKNEITTDFNKGKLKVISSDASKFDGLNASFYAIDELHEAKNNKMINVLESSQGMRENPLSIFITTAGFSLQSPAKKMFDLSIEILRGKKNDDSFFPMLFTLDENDNWEDPNTWIKSNPNLNITVTDNYIERQIKKAKNDISEEIGVKTKNLNMWCTDVVANWISYDKILKSSKKIDINDLEGKTAYLGIDLAITNDLTALSFLIVDEGKYFFKNYYYLPESALNNHPEKEFFKRMSQNGQLLISEGDTTDYQFLIDKIVEYSKVLNISNIYYDKFNASFFALKLGELGFNLYPFSQTAGNFNYPTKFFQKLFLDENIIIDENEINTYCILNTTLKIDESNENIRPIKKTKNSSKKIDGVIAMIQALAAFIDTGGTETYDSEIWVLDF